jgi:hypothetical protein
MTWRHSPYVKGKQHVTITARTAVLSFPETSLASKNRYIQNKGIRTVNEYKADEVPGPNITYIGIGSSFVIGGCAPRAGLLAARTNPLKSLCSSA